MHMPSVLRVHFGGGARECNITLCFTGTVQTCQKECWQFKTITHNMMILVN